MKKNNMAAKNILLVFINKRWTFISANKQLSWKRILQKSQELVSFYFNLYRSINATFKLLAQFSFGFASKME